MTWNYLLRFGKGDHSANSAPAKTFFLILCSQLGEIFQSFSKEK